MALVKCPTCGKNVEYEGNEYRPFCSERCKLVDLGKWLNEEPRISEPLRPEHFLEPDLEDGGDDEPRQGFR